MASLKYLIIKPGSGVLPKHLNLLVLTEFFAQLPEGVVFVKRRHTGNLLVKLQPESQDLAMALRQVTSINGHPISIELPMGHLQMGVIRHSEITHMTDIELLRLLRPQNVRYVQKEQDAEVAVLGWSLASPPKVLNKNVKLGWDYVPVRAYVQKPIRCYRCQLYGHTVGACRAKASVCPRCARSGHDLENCHADRPYCAACGEEHEASSSTCDVWREECAIAKLQHSHNLSHTDAKRRRAEWKKLEEVAAEASADNDVDETSDTSADDMEDDDAEDERPCQAVQECQQSEEEPDGSCCDAAQLPPNIRPGDEMITPHVSAKPQPITPHPVESPSTSDSGWQRVKPKRRRKNTGSSLES